MAAFVGDVVVLPAVAGGGLARCALGVMESGLSGADRPVTVVVRPQQIGLDGGAEAPKARVLGVKFHGHDGVVRIEVAAPDGGVEVTVRCPSYAMPAVVIQHCPVLG